VASVYFREEVFALVVRDLLKILFDRMHFKHVLRVNGHGADNQKDVLNRICHEYNDGPRTLRVIWVYPGFPRSLLAGAIGHAYRQAERDLHFAGGVADHPPRETLTRGERSPTFKSSKSVHKIIRQEK
jgi:hypothetical protein